MTINFDRKSLRAIARKTLGHSEQDERPISSVYIAHLRHFLAAHPDEQDFTIDLDGGDGAVFCRVCQHRVPPGTGEPEEDGKDIFGSMNNFEEHLETSAHRRRKASNSAQLPAAITPRAVNAMPGTSTRTSVRPRHAEDSIYTPPESVHLITSPDSRKFDDDYLYALKLDEELNGPRVVEENAEQQQVDFCSEPMDVDEIEPDTNMSRNDAPILRPTHQDAEELQEEFPFEETYHAQIQGILSNAPAENPNSYRLYRESPDVIQARCLQCHFSVALPGSGSFEATLDDVMQGVAAYEEHLNSPHHIRKRNEQVLQPSVQSSTSVPAVQLHTQPNPSMASHISPEMESSSFGKRRLPGAWYDVDEADRDSNPSVSEPFAHGQYEFTSASAVHQALNNLTQQRGLGMNYHPNRPVVPLPPSLYNPHPEGSASSTARNFAIRRFQEAQAATLDAYGSYGGMNAGDFNINYDDAGPVDVVDYGGADLDKRFKDFMHKALEEFKDVTTVKDAQKKLNMRTENDRLDGMQIALLPHQVIGVAWMVDQEKDEQKLGGILADAMGLGKTIQIIATMAYTSLPSRAVQHGFFDHRKPQSNKGKNKEVEHARKSTLVLAPSSLLQQWYEEFSSKTTPGTFRVHIHHGKDKLKTVREIEEYDVIIASHQSVVMDFPKEKKEEQTGREEDEDDSSEDVHISNQRTLGPLAKVQWLRVVIDEAQSIRNRSTRLSTCVAKLDSRYRWCLTGTPITNTLADIYGFLRFCQLAPWNDWKMFNSQVAKVQKKHPIRAGQKAQAILKPHLLRRTKDSTLDGIPIIRLGPKTIDMVELEFSPNEREIYEAVETSQKKIISRFLKEGTVMKNYSFILVMILRLRQLCCHPKLATTEAESEELDADKQKAEWNRAVQMMGAKKVEETRKRLEARILHRMKAELGLVEPENDDCPVCMEPIVENRRVTSCAHEFCSVCINEVLQKAEGRIGEDAAHCPLCRAVLDESHIFVGKIFEPSAEELEKLGNSLPKPSDATSDSERPIKKSKVDGALDDSIGGKDEDEDFDYPGKDNVEPSTKMQYMLETIMKWRTENPADKMIIYSQWTSMLDLVEAYLNISGIKTLRYDGKMNRLARVKSVACFNERSGPPIMLVSLKCGGVGLNLTVANRVINLDLAWNYATEAQAYDRVHRIGQQKPVDICRLIIRDTIEERIIRLQAKKQGLSDAALGEGTGSKLQRLTARDIAQLFDLR